MEIGNMRTFYVKYCLKKRIRNTAMMRNFDLGGGKINIYVIFAEGISY
jgi:hypothetical protein